MRQTIFLITIILFSHSTYGQHDRDTVIITHHPYGVTDTFNVTLSGYAFNQTEAKHLGLHIDSVTKLNNEFYIPGIHNTQDTIPAIINTDSTLIINFNFVVSVCNGEDITCLLSLDSNKILNLDFFQPTLCDAAHWWRFCATIHFRKINNPDISAVMINRNRKTIKQIKK